MMELVTQMSLLLLLLAGVDIAPSARRIFHVSLDSGHELLSPTHFLLPGPNDSRGTQCTCDLVAF